MFYASEYHFPLIIVLRAALHLGHRCLPEKQLVPSRSLIYIIIHFHLETILEALFYHVAFASRVVQTAVLRPQ